MEQNTEQLKKIEEQVDKMLSEYSFTNEYADDAETKEPLRRDIIDLLTKTTPSHDEIKREVLSDFHEKFWKWGISHMPTMYFNHVCNFLNDYIDETLTQRKEGGDETTNLERSS